MKWPPFPNVDPSPLGTLVVPGSRLRAAQPEPRSKVKVERELGPRRGPLRSSRVASQNDVLLPTQILSTLALLATGPWARAPLIAPRRSGCALTVAGVAPAPSATASPLSPSRPLTPQLAPCVKVKQSHTLSYRETGNETLTTNRWQRSGVGSCW